MPTIPPGSPDGAVWGAPADPTPGLNAHSSFNDPSLGSSSYTTFSSVFDATPVSGISFGGVDGSISLGDPWAATPSSSSDTGKKPSYATNPW